MDTLFSTRVELIKKRWLLRVLSVQCPDGAYLVTYNGWGVGYETVRVNEVEIVRRNSLWAMSARFEFLLGHRAAAITIADAWWKYLFLIPSLSYFQFELEGRTLYEEGCPPLKPPNTIAMTCRSCGYDIRASIVAGRSTCPECGATLGPFP